MGARRKAKTGRRPPPRRPAFRAAQVEARGALLAKEIARAGETAGSPVERLARLVSALFAAFEDGPLCQLLLEGWSRARQNKALRLELAWIREHLRLSVEEVLRDGIREGAFLSDLDAGAMAAVIVGAAEGLLLQSANEGGPVPPDRLAETLLRVLLRGPGTAPR